METDRGADRLAALRRLSDPELATRLKDLARGERGAMAELVAHLAELDTRDLHLRQGHGSLFAYCREVLALAEHEAYNRIAVSRAARRFPTILGRLESGDLSLASVRLLAPNLTPENHHEVLASAVGKSKLQVEEIAAGLWPRPDAPSSVRKLPVRPAPHPAAPERVPPFSSAPVPPPVPPYRASPPPARPAAEVTPLSPDRYRVQVTIGGDTLDKLRLAKDLLRHAVPSGDEAVILDRALTALLADLAQRKFAAVEKPQMAAPAPRSSPAVPSRHVPADVKRTVFLRDLGRCAYVARDGRRCAERAFLEFHHLHPHALGGAATAANLQLRCRAHNQMEGRADYGRRSLAPERAEATAAWLRRK